MRRNFDASRGLSMDEPVMLALADVIGRQAAHDLLYGCAMKAFHENRHLGEVLSEHPVVMRHLTLQQIEELMKPEKYLGTIPQQVEGAIAASVAARRAEGVAT